MTEGHDAVKEDGAEVEGMEMSQNGKDEERARFLGLVAIVALTQRRKATSGFKPK